MTCPLCAPHRAQLAEGETLECRHCDGAAPPAPVPPPRRRTPPADLERALACLLADLREIARGRLHADHGSCLLGHMQGDSGQAGRFDDLGGWDLRAFDASDPVWRDRLSRALLGADVPRTADPVQDPDWSRWRINEHRLAAVQGLRGRVLRWLLATAPEGATVAALAPSLAWAMVRPSNAGRPERRPSRRDWWLQAGWLPPGTQETPRRAGSAPRPRVRGILTPGKVGTALIRGACRAWWATA